MTRKERKQNAVHRHFGWGVLGLVFLAGCGGGSVEINGPMFSGNWGGFVGSDVVEKRTVSRELPVGNQVVLRLYAVNGDVSIVGETAARSVTVTAEMQVGSATAEDAKKGLDAMEVLVTDSSGEIIVQTLQPASPGGREYAVVYTILLPSDMGVTVTQSNGTVDVENMESPVLVDVTNGNVRLANQSGSADVSVSNGGIDAEVAPPPGRAILLSTGNGNVDLRISKSTSAAFSALVANGTIGVYNLELTNAVQTPKLVTGTLGEGNGEIGLRVDANGSIFVHGVT